MDRIEVTRKFERRFGKPGQVFNGDPDWSDKAKKEWVGWKARQDAAPKATEPTGR